MSTLTMAHTTTANADRTAQKLVIAHADDIGMCHGANTAFAAVVGKGFITSGSVMVPCPWFREIAEMRRAMRSSISAFI